MFGSCPWAACSFLKGNGGEVGLEEREDGDLDERRGWKLKSRYNTEEKNK